MHIQKPKQFMFISGIVLMILIFAFGIIWRSQTIQEPSVSETLIERPGVPQENWPRVLQQIETEENKKEIVNFYDGYKITIPSDWHILDQSGTQNASKIPMYKRSYAKDVANRLGIQLEQLSDNDLYHGHPVLEILSQTKNNSITLTEWIKQNYDMFYPQEREFSLVQVNGHTAYKASAVKLIEEEGIVENSLEIPYILENKKGTKVYILTCTAEGEGFLEQRRECEESIQTFELI